MKVYVVSYIFTVDGVDGCSEPSAVFREEKDAKEYVDQRPAAIPGQRNYIITDLELQ